ncbi:MAG: response regulator [Prolixibacteraceae bacterium]|nr:response regulator [Prolixibacteraceae bacterium]
MPKFKIEIQVTLIAIIIGAVVVTTGYFAYQSLSKIVFTIHQETRPDNRLFLMKDIANDLTAMENNVRLYALTNNRSDLQLYDSLQSKTIANIEMLTMLKTDEPITQILTDSLITLSAEKLGLWDDVLKLHLTASKTEPAFTDLYSKLEEQKTDTITSETEIRQKGLIGNIFSGEKDTTANDQETKPKGLLKKIFGGKTTIVDTTVIELPIEKDSIRQEVQNIETKMADEDIRLAAREKKLIERNIILTRDINKIIIESEKIENASLIAKTQEADQLAEITYKRLAIFTISAVILLLIALYMFFKYIGRSKNYQKALQNAKNEAENLAKAKEQFASNVSHELRTPVNAIYGLSEQLMHQNTGDLAKDQIAVIAQSARHLKNIINDTLDFSKIQSNKLKIDAVHFSPYEVFNEVINLEKNEANKKGIDLNFEIEGQLPDALVGDPVRLKQILINLIGNAIKFTDEGSVVLKVKSTRKKYLMHQLELTVIDSGIGMPNEHIKNIFDEFVQLENQSGKKFSGTGLGLSIVKKLVQLQKGTINVKSDEGVGTEISISIPYPEGKKENIEQVQFETITIPDTFKNLKILIADDEDFNTFLMKAILKKWGSYFKIVANGNEAVDAATRENFDLILMDLRMPGKNGIEAAKEILLHKPKTNIVAVTATNEDIDNEKCMAAGMKGVLLKPFSEKELFDKVKTLVTIEAKNKNNIGENKKIDFNEAKRFSNGDEAFLTEMSRLFLKSTNNGLEEIKKSMLQKDYDAIAEICHKMASPCKHFHAHDLYKSIKLLEENVKQKSNWLAIVEMVNRLESEINITNKIVKETLNI